ncbi:MAG: ABC transporter ATP-binding protein, partial [Oscillospiraceae bacterium]|nr:ABC transporter ATP-binding protein [Oscillospiraceae bacterium]
MVDFSLKNFSFFYPERDQASLYQINLDIHSGELIVLCGRSGSGKSTLLKMLKPELTPKGKMTGEIRIFSKQKSEISQRDSAEKIGFLLQNTEYQTVTHTVRSELAFGLENLGYSREVIRLRMAEICDYFSLEKLLDKKTCELSGGKKQLLCLAAVVAMHPRVLILDEPTAQLDPMTAQTLMETAARLCRENGMTVIICEQRLESVIP